MNTSYSTQKAKHKGLKRVLSVSSILLILFIVFLYAPVLKYRAVGVGEILPVKQYLNMEEIGQAPNDQLPTFYFTVVNILNVSTLNDYAYALLNFGKPVFKPIVTEKSDINYSFNDLNKLSSFSTLSSAQNLTIHALQQANRDVSYTVHPTVIVVYDAFETGKVFREGDRIIEVDHEPVANTKQFMDAINSKEIQLGTTRNIRIQRDGKQLDVSITYRETSNSGRPLMGVQVQDVFEFDVIDPLKLLNFNGEIEGNSAGLMMALQLTQDLTGTDLTHGYKIAGTGSLERDGTVGEVGSVAHKVMTAVENGVDIFFVPKSDSPLETNEKEAMEAARGLDQLLQIVPVSTFSDALNYLNNLKK